MIFGNPLKSTLFLLLFGAFFVIHGNECLADDTKKARAHLDKKGEVYFTFEMPAAGLEKNHSCDLNRQHR